MPVNASNTHKFGWKAINFNLLSVDGKFYDLNSLKGAKGTVIVFICNHCPYVIAISKRLVYETVQLQKIGVNTIAIMSNDVKNYPEDSYENMKLFSKKNNFNFQYLFDEDQSVAKNYKAICTPDFYGFDNSLDLKYRGRIDSAVMNSKNDNISRDLYNSMKIVVDEGIVPLKQYNSFGCSIKWK